MLDISCEVNSNMTPPDQVMIESLSNHYRTYNDGFPKLFVLKEHCRMGTKLEMSEKVRKVGK